MTLSSAAVAQLSGGTANFGDVHANGTAQACIQNSGEQYLPSNGGMSFSVPGGYMYLTINTINPGPNCYTVQFTQGDIDGSLNGSGSMQVRSTNGNTATLTISTTGTSEVQVATAGPKYEVLSILYTPPGDASSSGFSNQTSYGTTTSLANNFSTSDSVTFSGGLFGGTAGVTFGVGTSSSDSRAYAVSYSANSGSQLNTVQQAIDHTQDQVFLWINPAIRVKQTGSTTGYYSVGAYDNNGNYMVNPLMDVVNVNIAGLKNPSLIPLSVLLPQTPQQGVTLPGLANVCANPLPPNQCTQANACGCTAQDFAGIVAQDPMVGVTDQTVAPSSVDSNRYAYVSYVTLEGPQQQGAAPVRNSFSLTDGQMNSTTYSNGTSYTTGFTIGWKATPFFGLGFSNTNSFTYGQTQTAGSSNGTAHTGSVTMGSSRANCYENVSVYEDTTYHTFVYSLPSAAPPPCQ